MNSRERVLTALRFEEPDRVPHDLLVCDELRESFARKLHEPSIDLVSYFGYDIRWIPMVLPEQPEDVPVTEWTPLFTQDEVASCGDRIREAQEQGLAVVNGYHMGVFEHVKDWLGDVITFTMPYDDPDGMRDLLDRVTTWKMQVYGAYVEAGVDILLIGDDLGAQRSLIMSPEYYREWYRPCHQRLVAHLKSIRPNVKVAFHCCGHVTPLIPDLIELGIDVLQSVQAETMNIADLKKEFGRDIAFWGGVGAQGVLARTTPEQVVEGVRRTLDVMAPGGAYIAAPCHILTEEVSWKSVVAFSEAMKLYGAYRSSTVDNQLGVGVAKSARTRRS